MGLLGGLRGGAAGGRSHQGTGLSRALPESPVPAASLSAPRIPLPVEIDKPGSPCPSSPARPPTPLPQVRLGGPADVTPAWLPTSTRDKPSGSTALGPDFPPQSLEGATSY